MEVLLMSKKGAPEKLIIDGKRLDGRALDEFRPISLDVHVLKHAQGSASFSFGDTKALTGVFGPRVLHPRKLQKTDRCVMRCKYFMAPFSTQDRIRPGYSRRGTEISKVISEAFESVVYLKDCPKTVIDAFIEIIQASASTRCAGLNSASLALADAGIPMKDLISCVAVGKVDNTLVLDIGKAEDNYGDVDFAVATIGGSDKFVLIQMDGVITREEFSTLLEMSEKGCAHVHSLQQKALRKKYGAVLNE
jgi:exosome complex component RRP41